MADRVVYIVGPLKLQNLLITSFLEGDGVVKCREVESLRDVRPAEGGTARERQLILWDCFGKNLPGSLFELESHARGNTMLPLLALFNVPPNLGIEPEAVARGVQGIFYEEDPPEQFTKGIRAILNGELWISRKIMTESILRIQRHNVLTITSDAVLTRREMEILTMVAEGAENRRIADELYVSPHTVKTHLYNIFKKIGVPNRLQAALWAVNNLQHRTAS